MNRFQLKKEYLDSEADNFFEKNAIGAQELDTSCCKPAGLFQLENWRHQRTKKPRRQGQDEQELLHALGEIWRLQRTGSSPGSRSEL